MKFDLPFITHNEEKQRASMKESSVLTHGVSLFDLALLTRAKVSSRGARRALPQEELGCSISSTSSTRSRSIPLPTSHIERTHSEIQLDVDEAAAEQREITMFHRMVNGIQERQRQSAGSNPHYCNGFKSRVPASHELSMRASREKQVRWQPPLPKTWNYISDDSDDTDGWSITGYDPAEAPAEQFPYPRDEENFHQYPKREEYDDQCIFDIEL